MCIVNLYPSKETGQQIPSLDDYDLTKDRENDIRFHDETDYDLKLASVISDYLDFVERMGKIAIDAIEEIKDKNKVAKLKEVFIDILHEKQRTLTRNGEPRYYHELLKKRFDIEGIIKIQRQDDIHTIANKALDFSPETICNLIDQGIYDTLDNLYQIHKKKDKKLFKEWLNKYMEDIEKQNINDTLKPVLQFKEKERL